MPSPRDYLTDEDLTRAVLEATRLAWVVHEYDRDQVCAVLGHIAAEGQLNAVVVALAAMVDVDRSPTQMLAWLDVAATESEERARKPWMREEPYAACLPELDGSPDGCSSLHATPARYNSGCRGAGCCQARADYDSFRYRVRTGELAHTVSDAG